MKLLLTCAILILVLSGCESESITNSDSGTPNVQKGSITGNVLLTNAAGHVESDMSNARIAIEGTPYSTLSDKEGKWTLSNIPSGTYTFMFSKDGYGHVKAYNMSIVGGGILYWTSSAQLRKIPTFISAYDLTTTVFEDATETVSYDTTFVDSTGYEHHLSITKNQVLPNERAFFELGVRSPENVTYYVIGGIILFGTGENIDINDPGSYVAAFGNTNAGGVSDAVIKVAVTRSYLIDKGFKPGDRIYCVGYGSTQNSAYSYYDHVLKQIIYTGYSPKRTEVVEFNLP